MKSPTQKLLKYAAACLCLLLSLHALDLCAGIAYWDPEGRTGSYATYTNASLAGTWETTKWAKNSSGLAGAPADQGTNAPIAWVEGDAAVFAVGAGATNNLVSASTTTFTVTMNGNHTVAGIFDGHFNPNSCEVTIVGTGIMTLPAGAQGFNIHNSSDGSLGYLTISNVIAGGGPLTPEDNGQIFLNGVNTYTGGTQLGYAGAPFTGLVNFNNSASFGTGGIVYSNSGTLICALVAEGSAAITIPNSVTFGAPTNSLNLVGNTAGVTFSGLWNLNANPVQIGSGGAANNLVTISGAISGTGSLTKLSQSPSGILQLSGTNTYTGATTNLTGTLQIGGSGSLNSGNYAGAFANSATFIYNSSASQTLSGIVSGTGSVSAQAGTLILSGPNTYSGGTTLGTSGLLGIGNNTALGTGTLTMGGNGSFDNTSGGALTITNALTLSSGSPIFVGSSSLTINGLVTISGANRTITVNTNTLTLGSAITDAGVGRNLTKAGAGTLKLSGVNTFSNTVISAGTLALGSSGSLANSPVISISAGATFDVSAIASFSLSTTNTLTASGTASVATIKGGTTVNFGTRPITLNFDGTHIPLTISQGTLQLNGNSFTVNNTGAALNPGSYTLVSQTTGNITASGSPSVSVTGGGLASGNTASLVVSSGSVLLVVKGTPAFSALSSPSAGYGTTSVVLTGKVSAGTVYPTSGDAVTTTINGHSVGGTVTNSTGDFTITYNDASLATLAVGPHSITYAYAGGSLLNGVTNSSTSLTVTAASLSVTATAQAKTYGQAVSFGSGSTNFISSGLKNGETIGSVTLAVASSGGATNASVSGSPYTITPSAATGGTFTAANYSITYNPAALTVGPALLGVTANNAALPYGATNAVFTVTYTNFVNGEVLSTSDVVGSPALTSVGTNADVGTYAITNAIGTLASTNYTFALTNGVLTVTNALSTNVVTASTNVALPGAAVVFTSTLSALAPSGVIPTNLVSFVIDSTNAAGSVYPSSGVATLTNSTLSHGYHTIEADYTGDTNALGATNIIGSTNSVSVLINTPPVAGAASYGRPNDTALHIAISSLLTHASDADSDVVTLLAVDAASTNGATIVTNGSFLTYTQAATNGNVTDTFTYTVQDSFGATATGTVTVTNLPQGNGPAVNITGLNTLPNGTVQISFAGVPNYNYLVEATTNLAPPIAWTTLATNTAGTNGLFQYTDLDATNHPTRYYRTARP